MGRKSFLYLSLACLVACVLMALPIFWPAIAHAQGAAPEVVESSNAMSYVKAVGDPLIDTLALVVQGVLLALIGVGLAWLKKKWGIDAGQQVEAAIQDVVERSIGYAAEKAHKAAKLGEDAPNGAKKLRDALEFAEAEVQRLGYDVMARDKLVELIESRLGVERVKGKLPSAEKTG